jgi:ferredoxin like protein
VELEEKLAINAFKPDKTSHIRIRHEVCRERCMERHCLYICPAGLYQFNEELDEIQVEHAGCLECGTCLVGCRHDALEWTYPRGSYGVQYRYG